MCKFRHFLGFMNRYFSLDGTPEQVLEKLFRLFDVNEDGTISRPEMLVSPFEFSFWKRASSL